MVQTVTVHVRHLSDHVGSNRHKHVLFMLKAGIWKGSGGHGCHFRCKVRLLLVHALATHQAHVARYPDVDAQLLAQLLEGALR